MEVYKLRIRFGADELEAEGAQDWVNQQRDIFLERIMHAAPALPRNGTPALNTHPQEERPSMSILRETDMQKIASLDGDVITLSAIPSGETADQDSLMLLLLAHKIMRNIDSVLAGDLLAGMKQSGRPVERLDGIFAKTDSTLVIRTGVRKGTKYRLTNPGAAKAKTIAEQLLATVA